MNDLTTRLLDEIKNVKFSYAKLNGKTSKYKLSTVGLRLCIVLEKTK